MRIDRTTAAALAVIAAGAVLHQLWWMEWFIEDAAISFAYTRHLVQGDGLVAYPGGERLEGYSNFTWVMLLAPFQLLGLSGFESAKPVAAFLTILTVPLVYAIAREADDRRAVGLAAALAFAVHSQVAHWAASGLENSLFSFLLALGLWRMMVEARTGTWPWSALAFAALSATRPEAILYGAVAGFIAMVHTLVHRRSLRPTLAWLVTFFAPWGVYHAWRLWYFAWLFPQTYYAKMNLVEPEPFSWNIRGWKYVRNWAHNTGTGYLLPIFLLAVAGGSKWREWRVQAVIGATLLATMAVLFGVEIRALVPALLGGLAALFYASFRAGSERPSARATGIGIGVLGVAAAALPLATWAGLSVPEPPVPTWWTEVPSYTLIAIAALVPLVGLRDARAEVRITCWAMACVSVFFAVYSQGDWMANWRWMSLPAVPMCILLGLGAARFADLVEDLFSDGPWQTGWFGLVAVLMISAGAHIAQSGRTKRDIGPELIKRRVEYKQRVLERIHHRGPVVDLDVDMGGHMYWLDAELHDIAGLVDISLAQHKFARKFIRPFIFEEVRPHFAHIHGSWAKSSGLPSFPEWDDDYFELPKYKMPSGNGHPGNFMRRDLIMRSAWDGPPERKQAFGGLLLEGWEVPSPEVAAGGAFELHVGARGLKDVRMVAFLARAGTLVASWELPLGYDWLPPRRWRKDEVFQGIYDLDLPNDIAKGRYNLGFVVYGKDGRVMPASKPSSRPVFAEGEARFLGALTVVDRQERDALARADREAALATADAGRCEEAEGLWSQATAHRAGELEWREQHQPRVSAALARCWATSAIDAPDAVERLVRAQSYDHRVPEVQSVGSELAQRLEAEGMAAFSQGDWQAAFESLDAAAKADRTRSWARKYAEKARALWLETPRVPGW